MASVGAVLLAIGLVLVIGGQPRGGVAPAVSSIPSAAQTTARTVAPTLAAATPSPTIAPIPDGYRVLVPRLAIDLPIAEGDLERDVVVQQTPENFAFHFPGTAIPGGGSNTYIYAHARRGMFLTLWNARVGDEVIVTTPGGGALHYVVSEVHPRIPPKDTSWLQATPTERLTLQTSTGPSPDDPRFVVVAVPV
jgi:LPXTG-site transpeptidase (sortase) family protein